jgi:hypothetical protein
LARDGLRVLKKLPRYTTGSAVTHEMRSMFYVAWLCSSVYLSGLDISPELPLWARATSWSLQTPSADARLEGRRRQDKTATRRHTWFYTSTSIKTPSWTSPYQTQHRRILNMGALLSLPLLAIPSVGTVSPVLRRPISNSSYTDAWPTARNSSGIMLWRRNMQCSV